jgi:hypothetical protein
MSLVREKQIEFPPEQTHVRWLTPALIGLSIACVVVVIIILLTHESGSFIGPW